MYETRCQSRFSARCWMLGADALGRPRGMVWGEGREEGSKKKKVTFHKLKYVMGSNWKKKKKVNICSVVSTKIVLDVIKQYTTRMELIKCTTVLGLKSSETRQL